MDLLLLISVFFISISADSLDNEEENDGGLNAVQIIEKYGYPVETHKIETEDGYFLELHRIPYAKGSESKKPGIPYLLLHGLFGSSDEFLLLGSRSLAFRTADKGYDVWLGNLRGTRYGVAHRNYATDSNAFWDFSWHESGIYDLPAHIDYICNHTQHENIMFLGYSMGATVYFVTASLRPDYQKKIRGAVMMGPVATLKNVKSPIHALVPFTKGLQGLSNVFSNGKLVEDNPLLKRIIRLSCSSSPTRGEVCRSIIFFLAGTDPLQFKKEELQVVLGHLPSSTSTRTLTHYLQLIKTGKFHQYDFGGKKNLARYHSLKPPEYDLDAISTPMSFFIAPHDVFISTEDYDVLKRHLRNIKSIDIVPYHKFTHLDFSIGKDADVLVYEKLLQRTDMLAKGRY